MHDYTRELKFLSGISDRITTSVSTLAGDHLYVGMNMITHYETNLQLRGLPVQP